MYDLESNSRPDDDSIPLDMIEVAGEVVDEIPTPIQAHNVIPLEPRQKSRALLICQLGFLILFALGVIVMLVTIAYYQPSS
jgi:hypothetical protein